MFWLSAAISYLTTELVITNKRIIAKFGFIRRNTIEMAVIKVESIQVHQSILGRLLNYGSIIVSGAGNPKAPIPGVSKPLLFRKAFFEMQETKQGEPLESPRLIAS
nr:PH domain-containing protein [Hahella sp. HN01]